MRAAVFLGSFLAVSADSAFAKEPYDGIWGDSNRSCRAEEYRLGIGGNRFEWYEDRCKARKLSGTGRRWTFAMSCSGEGRTWRSITTVSLPSADRLVLENAPVGPTRRQVYKRCPAP